MLEPSWNPVEAVLCGAAKSVTFFYCILSDDLGSKIK